MNNLIYLSLRTDGAGEEEWWIRVLAAGGRRRADSNLQPVPTQIIRVFPSTIVLACVWSFA